MNPKSIQALAIVNKKSPRLNPYEIFPLKEKKNIELGKDEKWVNVEIKIVK
jgi:hypothetical protein